MKTRTARTRTARTWTRTRTLRTWTTTEKEWTVDEHCKGRQERRRDAGRRECTECWRPSPPPSQAKYAPDASQTHHAQRAARPSCSVLSWLASGLGRFASLQGPGLGTLRCDAMRAGAGFRMERCVASECVPVFCSSRALMRRGAPCNVIPHPLCPVTLSLCNAAGAAATWKPSVGCDATRHGLSARPSTPVLHHKTLL